MREVVVRSVRRYPNESSFRAVEQWRSPAVFSVFKSAVGWHGRNATDDEVLTELWKAANSPRRRVTYDAGSDFPIGRPTTLPVSEPEPRDDVLMRCLELLPVRCLGVAARVSHRWRRCAYCCSIWRAMCAEFGLSPEPPRSGVCESASWRDSVVASLSLPPDVTDLGSLDRARRTSVAFLGEPHSGRRLLECYLVSVAGINRRELSRIRAQCVEWSERGYALSKLPLHLRNYDFAVNADAYGRHTSVGRFDCVSCDVNLIRSPYHASLKEAAALLSQADAAVIVVPASTRIGGDDGVTACGDYAVALRYALIAFAFGVKRLVFAVNKMDLVGYSKKVFDAVCAAVSAGLSKIGWKPWNICFIPTDALQGEGVLQLSQKRMPWYTAKSLFVVMCTMGMSKELSKVDTRPLRVAVRDVYKISGIGTTVVGRVLSGTLGYRATIQFAPTELVADIGCIESNHLSVDVAVAGDCIGVALKRVKHGSVQRGFVFGDTSSMPQRMQVGFEAQIVVLYRRDAVGVGFSPLLLVHTAHVVCRLDEIIAKTDRAGQRVQANGHTCNRPPGGAPSR